jgi:hypothetical protein
MMSSIFRSHVPLTLQQMDVREVVDKAVQSCRIRPAKECRPRGRELPTPVVVGD